MLKHVGVVFQTMYLAATAMGLAPCALGAAIPTCSHRRRASITMPKRRWASSFWAAIRQYGALREHMGTGTVLLSLGKTITQQRTLCDPPRAPRGVICGGGSLFFLDGGRSMKKVAAVLFAAIVALGVTPVRGEEAEKAADALKALDAKLTDAFKTNDFKTIEKYTADNVIVIDPFGRVHDKKQYFEHLEKRNLKVEELKESDVKARVFGDTGIVTGLLTIKGKVKDKDISGDYRWTRVYNKSKGGEWMVVSEQHTYVKPKDRASNADGEREA